MIPLLTAAQVRELDRIAIEELGLPGVILMEAAGRALARQVEEMLPEPAPVAIACGKGNNGGDGFVAARILSDDGYPVTCLLMASASDYSGDAAVHLNVLQAMDVELLSLPELLSAQILEQQFGDLEELDEELRQLRERMRMPGELPAAVEDDAGAGGEPYNPFVGAALIVDCLLGTGSQGAPRDAYALVVDQINNAGIPVLACDLPTGVNSDTGEVHELHVAVDRTCSFAAWKVGLAVGPGAVACGLVSVHDIGIPHLAYHSIDQTPVLLEAADVAEMLPDRPADLHKGAAGRVVILGGSPGFGGAAILAAAAALKAGSGLVTLGLPDSLLTMLAAAPLEVMCRLLPAVEGGLSSESLDDLDELLGLADAIAVGPGLGTAPAAGELLRNLGGREVPLVIDADALNLLAGDRGLLPDSGEWVLTPHPGEAARLLGASIDAIQVDRLRAARSLADTYGCVVLLKGHHTVVADAEAGVAVIPTGTPAMATGGMGDALTGVIVSLLGQGLEPFEAACAGAWLHGAAGEVAADGADSGLRAFELIDALPAARTALNRVE